MTYWLILYGAHSFPHCTLLHILLCRLYCYFPSFHIHILVENREFLMTLSRIFNAAGEELYLTSFGSTIKLEWWSYVVMKHLMINSAILTDSVHEFNRRTHRIAVMAWYIYRSCMIASCDKNVPVRHRSTTFTTSMIDANPSLCTSVLLSD